MDKILSLGKGFRTYGIIAVVVVLNGLASQGFVDQALVSEVTAYLTVAGLYTAAKH